MRDAAFAWIAARYPTERIAANKVLAALWRTLFYLIGPRKPFIMRTPHYRLVAHPRKGTLTRAVIRRGIWERELTEVFVKFVRPGALIIDAGANFGHFALVASHLAGRDALILAFEPDPNTFELLQENVALLPEANVIPVAAGLSDRVGELALCTDAGNPGGHSFSSVNVREAGVSTHVPVFTVDEYLAHHAPARRLDLMKIDVQGFEAKLIAGARATITRDHPTIFCEVSPELMSNVGDEFSHLLQYLKGEGYTILNTSQNGSPTVSYEEAERFLRESGGDHADLVFVRDGT
jgi:FkbM family methyltransferase